MDDKVFCSNCGKQISRTTKFCPFCGAPNREFVSSDNDSAGKSNTDSTEYVKTESQTSVVTKSAGPKRQLSRNQWIALLAGLIVVVIAGVFGVRQYLGNRYDIYSNVPTYNTSSVALKNGKFKPKEFIQINNHAVEQGTFIGFGNQTILVASHIPIVKRGSQLHVDYSQGKSCEIFYSQSQLSQLAKAVPTTDISQLALLQSVTGSGKSEAGVRLNGHFKQWASDSARSNFNNRAQLVHYLFNGHKNVRLLNNHKLVFDFNAASAGKNVKAVDNYQASRQEFQRLLREYAPN